MICEFLLTIRQLFSVENILDMNYIQKCFFDLDFKNNYDITFRKLFIIDFEMDSKKVE